ncbi:hypothetical protein, partial [Haloferula sp. BvORR071]|uniref:hypothetical protein n=1 Tax=Haloferula sp. BvORR071 TaxID=1396141 RepID=UPI0005539401
MALHVAGPAAIGGAMKIRGISACLVVALLLPACRKPKEVTVDESRAVTMRDESLKLDATSTERFETPAEPTAPPAPSAGPSPLAAGVVPEGWSEQ